MTDTNKGKIEGGRVFAWIGTDGKVRTPSDDEFAAMLASGEATVEELRSGYESLVANHGAEAVAQTQCARLFRRYCVNAETP